MSEYALYLTPREVEILKYAAKGMTSREIAQAMGIARCTVQSHVNTMLKILGVHSRVAAIRVAAKHGLISLGGSHMPDNE